MGETWLGQSYLIFVQSALPDDNEIVGDCPLTLCGGAGTLAPMFTWRYGLTTTTMMTATPKRVAVASS
jgi:hypothetical protein